MNRKGMLVILSGFSGVGKGTVVHRLMEKYDTYALSISATTRKPREGEQDGREYHFKTNEAFEKLIEENRLIEYAGYCDHYYGTPRDFVDEQMALGRDVILEIELQGALKVKAQYPDAIMIYVMPPNAQALAQRLRGRGTEQEDVIRKRLARAVEESAQVDKYEYMVVNDDLEQCVEEVHRLIMSQHQRISRNMDFVEKIRRDLNGIAKGE